MRPLGLGCVRAAALAAAAALSMAAAAVELNSADLAALETVRGIGPGLSQRLIAERERAPFKDWADVIRRVPGVGGASAARLSDSGLTVRGQPLAPARGASAASSTSAN